jgi:WD40 repeat protein
MANSLIASDKGLGLVNDARDKQGWQRTDKRFLEAAEISRATLNRFYAQQPIKHDNFVAICKAVGIEKWQRVAAMVLSTEKPQIVAEIPPNSLAQLDRELRAWFKALRYEIEPDYLIETEEYFEWIIRIPVRSRFDRVLIHGITGEAGMQDLARVEAVVKERNLDEGCLVTDYRVSRSVAAYLAEEEKKGNVRIVCLTFDELIDRDVDFSPYIQWLAEEIQRLKIDKDYIQLDCSKPELDPIAGKYKTPIAGAVGAERIDDYMDEWLDSAQKNHISVLGEFGTGKTWFALHYSWVGIQAYLQAKSKRVKRPRLPLLITLRDYAKALNVDTVIAGFFFVNHNIRLNADVFDRLNRMGKLLILFDGFDEMANKINSQDAIDNFWALAEVIVPNSKAILTCRTEHFPTMAVIKDTFEGKKLASTQARVATAPKFEILNLHPLSIEQIQQVLTNRGATIETIEKILANPELADLVKRPMMVDLVLEALPEISAGKDIDLARVYLYALKHKLARDIETKRTFTSMADKLFFLCEVSWTMLSQNRLTLHYSQFPERLKELFGDAIEDNQLDHWHYDMMCQTILIRDGEGNYRPAHKSLLEFFVAFKFAAELGLLHDDFLDLVREPGERDLPIAERGYQWADYWQHCRETYGHRGEIARFQRLEIPKLVSTFGASPLIPAVMNLLLPMLDLEVSYRQMNPLLELMQWTQAKTLEQAKWLGSNAGSALVKLNPYGLEYQDLSATVLPDIDLRGVGLRDVNLTSANLTNTIVNLKTFSSCHAIAISSNDRFFCTGHQDGIVRVWLIDGRQIFAYYGHQCAITSLVISGNWLFSASDDKTVKQWDVHTGKHVRTFADHQSSVKSLVISENRLFSGSDDKTVKQWDLNTGKCLRTFSGHKSSVKSIAVNGDWLFAGNSDSTIGKWDINTGNYVQNFIGHRYRAKSILVIGNNLFSGSSDKTVKQWDINTGECLRTFSGHKSSVKSIAVSGDWLFSSSKGQTIKQWDIDTGKCIHTFVGHKSPVKSIAVSDKWLFSHGISDKTVRQWDINTGECISYFVDYQSLVNSIAVSKNSLFSSSSDKTIKQWDIDTGKCIRIFSGHQLSVVAISVNDGWLFSGSDDKTIKQWDIDTGKCIQTFIGHQSSMRAVAVSGKWLFSGSADKTIKQWDIDTGKCIQTFIGHQSSVRSVVMSEKWLFSGSDDKTIKQWDIDTGKCIQTFIGHQSSMRAVAVSGKWLFSGSADKTIKQWDIDTGKCIQTFIGHQSSMRAVAVSGKWLFSSNADNTVKQWDIAEGECVQTFIGHHNWVNSLVVSEEWLFSGSRDNTVKQWNIATGECIATFDNALCAGANITGVRGLTEAQISSLQTLGAISDAE